MPRCTRPNGWAATKVVTTNFVDPPGLQRENMVARLTSWIALVTSMPRGQDSVQLNVVRHRHTPSTSLRMSRRSAAASSRLSKMKRCALTIAAGPKYVPSLQNTGQLVVQHAHKMHLVVSS